MKYVVFDMDGTLSIVGDRLKHLKNKDWDSFYKACDEDKINTPVVSVFKAMRDAGHPIKIVTGRVESVRMKTHQWLYDNGMYILSSDIHMRKDGDYRHDVVVKPELVAAFADSISMVFEDRASMVNKWREMGIPCFQVAEGDF